MAITDIFSSSFLFSIAIIIILIGGIFAYVSYRMGEQDHKLNSMIGLVSTMAEETQFFRNKLNILQQQLSTQDLPVVDKIQYASQMMGGIPEELINVSDDEVYDTDDADDDDADDDDADDDDADDDDADDDDADDDDADDDDDTDDDDADELDNNSNIKRLNLTLTNDEPNVKIAYEEVNTDNDSYVKANNLVVDVEKDLAEFIDFETTIEETKINVSPQEQEFNSSILNELKEDNNFLKNVSITDFCENTLILGEIDEIGDIHASKTDYKKMSLNKLREVVVSKGLISDSSKLKKNELLKLLGDE